MRQFFAILLAVVISLFVAVQGRLAGECAMLCNDLRLDVLNMEICREARKTLPRPKVGDFCMNAMEQGFSDACVALCMEQEPIPRVAQTCRAAAIEMPRPTVRRWCEHGYNSAFGKTLQDLDTHFIGGSSDGGDNYSNVQEVVTSNSMLNDVRAHQHEESSSAEGDADRMLKEKGSDMYNADTTVQEKVVMFSLPITLDDSSTKTLTVYQDEGAEEAVVRFCKESVEEGEVSTCIRQLVGVVIEKMNNL